MQPERGRRKNQMTHALLRFKDFIFTKNPAEISVKSKKASPSPSDAAQSTEISAEAKIIKGTGSFSGEEKLRDSLALQRLFDKGGTGALFLSDIPPLKAVMTSLNIYEKSGTSDIFYDIEFCEIPEAGKETAEKYATARKGDSLWNISLRENKKIEELISLNPRFIDPYDVREGDEVKLK